MPTESEVKIARYNQVEKEADALGRLIGVRRLKPSEQTRLAGMTGDITGSEEVLDQEGNKVLIPHRMPLMLTASVCMIDDVHIPFPRTRGELDAMYDRLDVEGLAAVGRASIRLVATDVVVDGEGGPVVGEAKNS